MISFIVIIYKSFQALIDWVKLEDPTRLAAYAAFIAVIIGILGIFREFIISLFKRPTLKVSVKCELPDCLQVPTVITDDKGIERGRFPSFYLRLKIENSGNYHMEDVEVMAIEKYEQNEIGEFEKDNNFIPLNLAWSNYRHPINHKMLLETMQKIQPRLFKHISLGCVIESENANLVFFEMEKKSTVMFQLTTVIKTNRGTHIFYPGLYRIKLIIAANNLKPESKIYEIWINDDWTDIERDMFEKNIAIKEVKSLT